MNLERDINKETRILMIDDDSLDLKIMKDSLEKLDVKNEIILSRDGETGLETLRSSEEGSSFIILLDLKMPKMDGFEFLSELRTLERFRNTIVFILSTTCNAQDKVQAYKLGVTGYLIKGNNSLEVQKIAKLIKSFATIVILPS